LATTLRRPSIPFQLRLEHLNEANVGSRDRNGGTGSSAGQRLKRGVFRSVADLQAAINPFLGPTKTPLVSQFPFELCGLRWRSVASYPSCPGVTNRSFESIDET